MAWQCQYSMEPVADIALTCLPYVSEDSSCQKSSTCVRVVFGVAAGCAVDSKEKEHNYYAALPIRVAK